jgi:HK97 family phage major capsid protein
MPEPYRVVSCLPTGTAVSRYISAKALGGGDRYRELTIAAQWLDSPQVKATLELHEKAAVAAGSTTDATWAGPLAPYGIASEALTIMRGMSILGALESKMRRVPLHARIARETGAGITGGWIAPGAPIPVQVTAFATIVEEHFKFGVIVPLAEELVMLSSPDAEAEVRRTVLGGLVASIDNQLLLPTVAVSAGVNPASITNGSTEVTTTGTTTALITADLRALMAAVTTNSGGRTWIMRDSTAGQISAALGSAAPDMPRTLFGYPVIVSNNSPAQITLVDAGAILYSDSGQFDLDLSTEATYQLDTAPADPTLANTVMLATWQRNVVSIRALRWLAWLNPSPTTSAAFMTIAY